MLSGKVFGQRSSNSSARGLLSVPDRHAIPIPIHLSIINTKCHWHINLPSEPFNQDSRKAYGPKKLDIAKCSVHSISPFN
jgi:hypothetical protein